MDQHHQEVFAGAASQHRPRAVGVVVQVLGADVSDCATVGAGTAGAGHVVYEDLPQKSGAAVAVKPQLSLVHISCHPPVGPNLSVLMRSPPWPSATREPATDSTNGVGPQTNVSGLWSGGQATSASIC